MRLGRVGCGKEAINAQNLHVHAVNLASPGEPVPD